RAAELAELAEGVLDTDDVERVHDMRVATRRLRAALEVFEPCFPPKPYAAALREVKRLADALGARRDPDVHLHDMEDLAERLGVRDAAGVPELLCSLRDEQEEGNRALAKALRRASERDLVGRLEALARRARA
ncbi:MAG TPA: CHAD domain-containing protein, partial [Solirubrobacteraceae bacterium]|nr:CHAD domain-containing protein [Solirubrobacteraceae bacterium]